ncbi:hypothetical protein OH491_10435 [Termitidicoccus mucosus]|uniref:Uncharacterized protein n=1 Tax=Termitidicoccus mucosus TaxID=1184151 RepID=A0A178IER9_9BACT|nr:hypothetical protein AW736_16910 [Opitutaceae bacterium TSB47]
MALKKALGNNDNEQTINPEVDAKLTQYIKDNPKLHAHYNEMTKEFLVRKMMLSCMRRSEVRNERDQELVEWINQNPEIKARVEERIRRVSPDRRERAFIAVAREEMQTHLLRQGASAGMRP